MSDVLAASSAAMYEPITAPPTGRALGVPHVVVYVRDGCPPCSATTRRLDRLGVAYETRDADEHLAELRALGASSTPVVTETPPHGQSTAWWQGYRPELIDQLKETQ